MNVIAQSFFGHLGNMLVMAQAKGKRRIDLPTLRAIMLKVQDPITQVNIGEARNIARRLNADSAGLFRVAQDSQGPLVMKYTKKFTAKNLTPVYPYLIATEDGTLVIAKKVDPEKYVIRHDIHDIPLHPANEEIGSKLLEAIGSPSYKVVRGKHYEYLEFIPGIDLMTAKKSGILEEIKKDPELFAKLKLSIGVALAQAYVTGTRDRPGGIRVNFLELSSQSLEGIRSGSTTGVYNIDMSSALDTRVFEYGLKNYLVRFLMGFVGDFESAAERYKLDPLILEGFILGYRQCQDYYRRNIGKSSDAIRLHAGDKADMIFRNLDRSISDIEAQLAA